MDEKSSSLYITGYEKAPQISQKGTFYYNNPKRLIAVKSTAFLLRTQIIQLQRLLKSVIVRIHR